MCGIFGFAQSGPVEARDALAMSRLLRHRGPDDEGFLVVGRSESSIYGGAETPEAVFSSALDFTPTRPLDECDCFNKGGVVLGHRRLSILDLSPAGHQPMSYRNRYWMIYNGEVYNYIELREELISLGHTFHSGSDSEVVMAAFAEWGKECLSRFNGMWSLAILDCEAGELFLARDRFGVKPLYYWHSAHRFAFASEIKAFSAFSDWAPKANVPRVLDFLVWTVSDHTDQTMFEGVGQLRGGHYAVLDVSALLAGDDDAPVGELQITRWYTLQAAAELSGGAAEEALRTALEDSVKLRLRADVPIGSCLSGGLDSSSIVSLVSRRLRATAPDAKVKTFTARQKEEQFDEGAYAEMVVAAAGAEGHTTIPNPRRLFEELDKLVWHQDEPFGSTSIFAQWCVFAKARENGVTVMLDGQGADEILGGYRGFFGAHLAGLVRTGKFRKWLNELRLLKTVVGFSYPRSIGYTAAYSFPPLKSLLGWFDNRAYGDLGWLRPAQRSLAKRDPLASLGSNANSVRAMSAAQVNATNLPMLLRWEDRNSMAFAIEARVPFLDYRLVETALGIADSDKVGGGVAKAVLRKAMRGIVPDAILDRRDKMGFVTAEALWMTGEWAGAFRARLASAIETLPQILDPSLLVQFDDVVRGGRPFDHRFWRAIAVGEWARIFRVTV